MQQNSKRFFNHKIALLLLAVLLALTLGVCFSSCNRNTSREETFRGIAEDKSFFFTLSSDNSIVGEITTTDGYEYTVERIEGKMTDNDTHYDVVLSSDTIDTYAFGEHINTTTLSIGDYSEWTIRKFSSSVISVNNSLIAVLDGVTHLSSDVLCVYNASFRDGLDCKVPIGSTKADIASKLNLVKVYGNFEKSYIDVDESMVNYAFTSKADTTVSKVTVSNSLSYSAVVKVTAEGADGYFDLSRLPHSVAQGSTAADYAALASGATYTYKGAEYVVNSTSLTGLDTSEVGITTCTLTRYFPDIKVSIAATLRLNVYDPNEVKDLYISSIDLVNGIFYPYPTNAVFDRTDYIKGITIYRSDGTTRYVAFSTTDPNFTTSGMEYSKYGKQIVTLTYGTLSRLQPFYFYSRTTNAMKTEIKVNYGDNGETCIYVRDGVLDLSTASLQYLETGYSTYKNFDVKAEWITDCRASEVSEQGQYYTLRYSDEEATYFTRVFIKKAV